MNTHDMFTKLSNWVLILSAVGMAMYVLFMVTLLAAIGNLEVAVAVEDYKGVLALVAIILFGVCVTAACFAAAYVNRLRTEFAYEQRSRLSAEWKLQYPGMVKYGALNGRDFTDPGHTDDLIEDIIDFPYNNVEE